MRREERLTVFALGLIGLITAGWWALALWPAGPSAPQWLERTRYVCFGIEPGGLPDIGGWVGLIGSPLGMLGILVVGWGSALASGLRRLRQAPVGRAVLASAVLALTVGVATAGVQVKRLASAGAFQFAADGPVPETYPRLDREAPPLVLAGHRGDRVDVQAFAGRPVIVTFAYAHCATICPLLVTNARTAQLELAGAGTQVELVVVTLDPWRDTPSRLPSIAERWLLGDRAHLLGGDPDEVVAAIEAWQVPIQRNPTTGEVTHPSLTYLVDQRGRIAYATTGESSTIVTLVGRL